MRGVTSEISRHLLGTRRFQLTRLMRGVTIFISRKMLCNNISTHTPHARRDAGYFHNGKPESKFQLTRLMRGVTGVVFAITSSCTVFQLTRLMRGVTVSSVFNVPELIFQLTRLMRGVTVKAKAFVYLSSSFQLTRLMRGVTSFRLKIILAGIYFNSHASCEA